MHGSTRCPSQTPDETVRGPTPGPAGRSCARIPRRISTRQSDLIRLRRTLSPGEGRAGAKMGVPVPPRRLATDTNPASHFIPDSDIFYQTSPHSANAGRVLFPRVSAARVAPSSRCSDMQLVPARRLRKGLPGIPGAPALITAGKHSGPEGILPSPPMPSSPAATAAPAASPGGQTWAATPSSSS